MKISVPKRPNNCFLMPFLVCNIQGGPEKKNETFFNYKQDVFIKQ